MALTRATGSNNSSKQVSVNAWNAVIDRLQGVVDAASDHGLSTSGTGAANVTALTAAIAAASSSSKPVVVIPPGSYPMASEVELNVNNLTLVGYGATLAYEGSASSNVLDIPDGTDGVTIEGLTISDADGTNVVALNNYGTNTTLYRCTIEYGVDSDAVSIYTRSGATGFKMLYCTVSGNAEVCDLFAGDALFYGNSFLGASTIADDCIAIKAIAETVQGIRIVNNYCRYHSNICGIGSQIGTQGADDTTYSGRARGILIAGNFIESAARIVYIKPGALAVDYRYGLVEAVRINDNILYDLGGSMFVSGIVIAGGRAAWIRDIKGRGNTIVARCKNTSGHKVGLDVFAPTGLGSAPQFEDIDVEFTYHDPYNGAAFGTAGTEGYPLENFVNIEDDNSATFSNIILDFKANGCSSSGVRVHTGVNDNAVKVRRMHATNYNAANSGSDGGFRTAAAIEVLTDDVSTSGNGSAKVLDTGGSFAAPTNPLLA